jgi:hypothetical protein
VFWNVKPYIRVTRNKSFEVNMLLPLSGLEVIQLEAAGFSAQLLSVMPII